MAKKQISKSGAAKLREDLDYLITVRRQEMAQKLKEARAQGDLSENAEYDEAKNEQAILEAQIAEIQFTLDNSEEVDDANISIDEVGLGSTVKLKNFSTGKVETLQIVSANEADFSSGKISDESPIGKAAMKKKVGDTFLIEAPVGELKFEILEIGK
ncbi:MAG: transcription elongation factor GreA [Ruminococcus sp.]|nr:transcription elongation factor GreA [Ruminococcus sp.]